LIYLYINILQGVWLRSTGVTEDCEIQIC